MRVFSFKFCIPGRRFSDNKKKDSPTVFRPSKISATALTRASVRPDGMTQKLSSENAEPSDLFGSPAAFSRSLIGYLQSKLREFPQN